MIRKVVDGVSSDWQWYTLFGALERRLLAPEAWAAGSASGSCGSPAARPTSARLPPTRTCAWPASRSARTTCSRSATGRSPAVPGITEVDGTRVTFADGSTETVDVIVSATGYAFDAQYLPELDEELFHRTFDPDLLASG